MRVNKTFLNNQVDRINAILKENGVNIEYGLNRAYGGYRLVKYEGSGESYRYEGAGESYRSHRLTAREMYYTLNTLELALIDLYY